MNLDGHLQRRPAGVRVQRSMEGVEIALSARSRMLGPRRSLHRAPLSARLVPSMLIFVAALLLMAPLPVMLVATGHLEAEPSVLAVCALLALGAVAAANLSEVDLHVRAVQHLPAATISIRTHSLVIDAQELSLDTIEQVTVDRAGARMRVSGQIIHLIPERSEAERAWLGALLAEVVARRQRATRESSSDKAALEQIIKQF